MISGTICWHVGPVWHARWYAQLVLAPSSGARVLLHCAMTSADVLFRSKHGCIVFSGIVAIVVECRALRRDTLRLGDTAMLCAFLHIRRFRYCLTVEFIIYAL